MASSISRPKVGHGSSVEHRALQELGAPVMSLKELACLQQTGNGAMGQVLSFVLEHFKDRRVYAVGNSQPHLLGNVVAVSVAPQGRTDADKAVSSLAQAQKTLEVFRDELERRQDALASKQREVDRLRDALDSRLRVKLLLDALEQKERARVERLRELARLIDNHRRVIDEHVTEVHTNTAPEPPLLPEPLELYKISRTRDALMVLHLQHINLTRRAAVTERDDVATLESRLRRNIARQTGLPEQDAAVTKEFERCTMLARKFAGRVPCGGPVMMDPDDPASGLENPHASDKKNEVQRLSDVSVALLYLCEHYVQSLSASASAVAALLSPLATRMAHARGYIDILQSRIVSREQESAPSGFMDDVRRACRLRGDVTLEKVCEVVGNSVRDEHEKIACISTTLPDPLPPHSAEQLQHIGTRAHTLRELRHSYITDPLFLCKNKRSSRKANYKAVYTAVSDRSTQLLQNTLDKAAQAEGVKADIETLLREREALRELI